MGAKSRRRQAPQAAAGGHSHPRAFAPGPQVTRGRGSLNFGQTNPKNEGRHTDGPEAMTPDRRASPARRASGCGAGRGRPRAWRPGRGEVAADAGGEGVAGCRRHAFGPGGSGRPRRSRVDDEGADDHQGEQDVADLRAYDVHGCVLAGAGHAASAYAEVARWRCRQVAVLAARPAVFDPCRFGTPRLLPFGTPERELRDLAFA